MRNDMLRSIAAGWIFVVGSTSLLQAGMPMIGLTEYGQYRVSTYSFFLVGFFLSALIIKGVWNSLQADFPKLPRLTYKSSLLVTTIWGVLFVLVLTMISGARELMTPGAWERNGSLYKIKEPTIASTTPEQEQAARQKRRFKLERLQGQLWMYALQHEGQFPDSIDEAGFDEEYWTVPDQFGIRYLYRTGLQPTDASNLAALVVEPDLFDEDRYVLFTNGSISPLSAEQVRELLRKTEAEDNDVD